MQTPQREFASAKLHKKNDIRKFVCHFQLNREKMYEMLYWFFVEVIDPNQLGRPSHRFLLAEVTPPGDW